MTFKSDHRITNKGLHHLYMLSAIKHLLVIDRCLQDLHRQCNTNMTGACLALYKERARLLKENAAYAEAQEFLKELAQEKLICVIGDTFSGVLREEE